MGRFSFRQRGVFLVFVLVFLVFIVMFAAIGAALVNMQLNNAAYFYRYQAAVNAADAGIQYAISRLSTNKYWAGYDTPGSGLSVTHNGIEVFEHYLGDSTGCVEGRISMGSQPGYFAIYFRKPLAGTSMTFFGANGEAGPVPERIIMSKNNSDISASVPVYYYDDPGTPVPGRVQPRNTVLLVSRGKSGSVERTVEVVVRVGADLFNTVAWARNSFDVSIRGLRDYDKMVLGDFAESYPSYIRSGVTMDIGLHPGMAARREGVDYLTALLSSGGECNNRPTWKGEILPLHGSENFLPKDGQNNVPTLTLDEVLKNMNAESASSDFLVLKAGTYVVMSDPNNSERPIVRRYATDSSEISNLPGTYEDLTSDFKREYLDTRIMNWNDERSKLTITRSFRSNPSGDLKNLNFISDIKKSVSIQLGPDASEEDLPRPTYMVNNEGSIHIEGQLMGVGTVICGGDLSMEAESKLLANSSNGLNIFCGGSVTINEIRNSPLKTHEQVIWDKIWQFITANKTNEDYQTKPGAPVDFHNDPENPDYAQSKAYVDRMNSLEYVDQYAVPRSIFAQEDLDLLSSILELPDGESSLFVEYSRLTGKQFPEPVLLVDLSPRTVDAGIFENNHSATGVFRIWYLDRQLIESEAEGSGVCDEKGRPISYKDSIFKGLIYCCRDFKVYSPNHSFVLEGGLIAFGGDTEGNKEVWGGNIVIDAADCRLSYDDQYLQLLSGGINQLSVLYWTNYQ